MKIKKGKIALIIVFSVVILICASISVMAIIPSDNKNYKSTLDEVYSYLKGEYKNKSNDYLTEIVGYINDEPIYRAEIVAAEERGKIFYNDCILYGETNSEIIEIRKSDLNDTEYERIKGIARVRVIVIEAEKNGLYVSDEEVKKAQDKIMQERKAKIAQGDEAAIEIEKQYQELYDKLGITEQQYYQNYDFLFQKCSMIGIQLANKYSTEYYENIKLTGEAVDMKAWDKYTNNLLEEADFVIVDKSKN